MRHAASYRSARCNTCRGRDEEGDRRKWPDNGIQLDPTDYKITMFYRSRKHGGTTAEMFERGRVWLHGFKKSFA